MPTSTRPATQSDKSAQETSIPVDDLLQVAYDVMDEHYLLDDIDRDALADAHGQLLGAAHDLGITDWDGLLLQAEEVVRAAGEHAHALSNSATRTRLRNCLEVLIAATALATGDRHRPIFDDASGAPGRQSTGDVPSDEVVLLARMRAVQRSFLRGNHPVPACQYALVEAGANPSETTVVTPEDFDNPRSPSCVRLPGKRNVARARIVPLPRWTRPVLARGLDLHLARHADTMRTPFLYDGRHPVGGNKACASASGNISRVMREAGINGIRPMPTDVIRWRITVVLRNGSLVEAAHLLGKRSHDAVYAFTGIPNPALSEHFDFGTTSYLDPAA